MANTIEQHRQPSPSDETPIRVLSAVGAGFFGVTALVLIVIVTNRFALVDSPHVYTTGTRLIDAAIWTAAIGSAIACAIQLIYIVAPSQGTRTWASRAAITAIVLLTVLALAAAIGKTV
jgi:hypothetical protein